MFVKSEGFALGMVLMRKEEFEKVNGYNSFYSISHLLRSSVSLLDFPSEIFVSDSEPNVPNTKDGILLNKLYSTHIKQQMK